MELGEVFFVDRPRGPAHRDPSWLHWLLEREKGAGSRFSVRRCEGTLYGAPSRRLADRVSFGNLGMRYLRNA